MTIDVENFEIFSFPPYFFFALLGIAASFTCYMFLLFASDINVSKKNLLLCIFTIIGIMLGARLFGVLTNIAIALYNKEKIGLDVIYKAGLVYYGGLFGGIFCYWIGTRVLFKNQNVKLLLNPLAVSIPLFHSFGRLGCMFAGCCYGKEYHGFGHINYIRDGVTTETFPVQALESVTELSIFCFMLVKYCISKNKQNENMLINYFILYAIGRFFIEFLRGDPNRGCFGILSFSKMVSVMLFIFCIFFLLTIGRKNENN